MSKIAIFLAVLITTIKVSAQECEAYFPMEKGTTFETTSYDKKDKPTGKSSQKVIEKTTSGNTMSAKVEATNFDKKDKEIAKTEYIVKCEGGKFFFDMNFFLDQEQMKAYQGMEVVVDGDFLEFPSGMKAGDKLKDGHITVTIGNSGMTIATIKVDITEREVLAVEEVTTPAGTFTCVKISYNSFTKMGIIKVTATVTEWYAKNVGLVKSESFKKNGKFLAKNVLTKFEK